MRIEANKKRKEMYHVQKFVPGNLRLMRNIHGLSQENVAKLLHMSRSCYRDFEIGTKLPDFKTICILSKFYDVSLDYLLTYDITELITSQLKIRTGGAESRFFMENYMKLSHGGKQQVRTRVLELLEKERSHADNT